MPLLTLSLTVLLAQLFSVPWLLYSTLNITFGEGLPGALGSLVNWLVAYGPPLIAAWWMLKWLDAASFAKELKVGPRWMKIGVALFATYLVLNLGSHVLGAAFFGPRTAPRIVGLLLVASKACLLAGLVIALCSELPRARFGATLRDSQ